MLNNKEQALEALSLMEENRHSVSNKQKADMIDFFGNDFVDKTILEVGTAFGATSRIFSFLFKEVDTIELVSENIKKARELNKDRNNINYYEGDAYNMEWPDKKYDVIFIDCIHSGDYVNQDITNSLKRIKDGGYIVFDDYGAPFDRHFGIPVKFVGFTDDGAPIEQLCPIEDMTHEALMSLRGKRLNPGIEQNEDGSAHIPKRFIGWDAVLVKESVDHFIKEGKLKKIKGIGYGKNVKNSIGCDMCGQARPFRDTEGIICQVV